LIDVCQKLESGELTGNQLRTPDSVFTYLARWKNAQHGHYVAFEWDGDELYVLRFIHSAMDLPQQI